MIVVSNASPLAALAAIGYQDLLPDLFGEVIVPWAAWDELSAASQIRGRLRLLEAPWLLKQTVENRNLVIALQQSLGAGESEAIALALETRADLLLMDERLGRRYAERYGLSLLGAIGVIAMAKRSKLIESVGPLLDQLRSDAGFYISDALRSIVLGDCGESPDDS